MSGFEYQKDDAGLVTILMDMDGPVNLMNGEYRRLMTAAVERLERETDLHGVIIASAKRAFFAGGDLESMLAVPQDAAEAFFRDLEQTKSLLRRIEKLPVPVVAAINGAALGGGFEICLACNRRIVVADSAAVVGLPEVTLGLLPGGGGIVRMVNLLGLEKALPHLLEGTRSAPAAALAAGLVDEIVAEPDELIPRARRWLLENPTAARQPWDTEGHRIPGGSAIAGPLQQFVISTSVTLERKTRGLLPAPLRVLAVASEATIVDFETALRIESRGLTHLVMTPQAKNLITTNFFQMNQVKAGAARPKGIERTTVNKLGILGAGMMGQGIAYVAAMAGIPVVLRDLTVEAAEKGKAYSARLLDQQLAKGRIDATFKESRLGLIHATAELADLAGCDLIVEAVFEDIELKARVIEQAQQFLASGGLFASNTSTLPISRLARSCAHPAEFVGIHFFSPVEQMPLVEIIRGEKTSPATLARAFDFARQLGKTAIIVNDSVGFFTSRVFGTFLDEGARLLQDGADPAVIDNLGRQVGMPVGPLAVQDEVSQELTLKVARTQGALRLLGTKYDISAAEEVCTLMVERYQRGGRYHGGGFYEYSGKVKRIWPELHALFGNSATEIPPQDIKDRLLFRQVIESIKCLQEGVLRTVADGNVGSLLGIGAPAWTGGFLQFVNTYGIEAFHTRTTELAERYGSRFAAPELLRQMSERKQVFE